MPSRNAPSRRTRASTVAETQTRPPPAIVETADEGAESIDVLVERVGGSSVEELAVLVGDADEHALIEAGRHVSTPRVTSDAERIGAAAYTFLTTADDSLRAHVKLSVGVVRALVWGAAEGHRAWRALMSKSAERRSTHHAGRVRDARPLAIARLERDQLAGALCGVAGGSSLESQRISAALAPAASGHPDTGPGRSLASLVAIGREYLASNDADCRARCQHYALTNAWLDSCARTASEAVAAERAAAAPAVADSSDQAAVDRWDGVNLLLMERVIRAFNAGNARDPGVPKLRAVSLRGVVGPHPKRKAKPTQTG